MLLVLELQENPASLHRCGQQNPGPKTVEAESAPALGPLQFSDHSLEGLKMAL